MRLSHLHILVLGSLALSAAGCFPGPGYFKQQEMQVRKTSSSQTVDGDNGVVTMAINPDAKTTQNIQAVSGSAIQSAAAAFPPGAINIAMNISLEEASSIATPATAGHLNLDNSFLNAGKAVAVTASAKADAAKPFTLSLPLPGASLHFFNNNASDMLSVVFKVKVAATDEIKTGVIPRKDLVIADGLIKIQTTYFGIYQAVVTEKLVAEKVETNIATDLQMKREEKNLPPLEVLARQPVVVKYGDTVTLTGKNFRPTMTLAWNGSSITKLKYVSDSQVSFTAPNDGSLGLLALNVEQEGSANSISLVFQGDGSKLVGSFSPDQVCSDVNYYDLNGKSQQGTRNCSASSAVACSSNGQVGCLTTSLYKSADISDLVPANIRTGATIAGVLGTYPSLATPLAGASATSDLTSLAASTAAGNYEFWDSTGTRYTGSISDAGAIIPMASNQTFNTSLYRQFSVIGDVDLISTNIKDGINVFGVTGSLTGAPANCSTDGETGCLTTVSYKAADMVNAVAGNIKAGINIAGITGSAVLESHTDCNNNAVVGCVTTSMYKSADLSNLVGGNIKNGAMVAGIIGEYPSATYPLAGADATTDLKNPTFSAQITSPAIFEWFDSFGTRYSHSGEPNIMPLNIVGGVSIFGVAGSVYYCTFDGETGCITNPSYKAAKMANYNAWDVRHGVTIAGVSGNFFSPKNMVSLSTYDRLTGVGSMSGPDAYDTIDDLNNGAAFPSATVGTWPVMTGNNWIMDVLSDTNSNGLCDGGEQCILKDHFTNLMWTRGSASYAWEQAISGCENLTSGPYTDWRLPTQKELMQAYTNGIWSQKASNKLSLMQAYYWTATTGSQGLSTAYQLNPALGTVSAESKTLMAQYLCVR